MRTRRFCTSKFHRGPRWLLHTEFHVKKWGDIEGTWVAQLQSACKACQRIAARETQARRRGKEQAYKARQYQKQTLEEKNRRKRERYYRQRQDPKWMRARRKHQRDAYKKAQKREYVDAAPFLEWIKSIELAKDMYDYQYIYKALRAAKGSKRITIATMDRILTSLDRTDLLQVFTQNTTPV